MAQQSPDSRAVDAESQPPPESATNGTARSDSADKENGSDAANSYGTRSRQRNGSSRPNYAEDKDIEMDLYDYYHDKKDPDSKKSSRQVSAAATPAVAIANGNGNGGAAASRKSLGDEAKAVPSQQAAKDQSSNGATSASQATQASGVVQQSRKRKAAAQQTGGVAAVSSTRRAGNGTQNSGSRWPESNMLTFENCGARPQNGQLVADDGTVLKPNDYVYLVCEPPGEPYYLGRIMEFLHSKNDNSRPVDAVRINWFYRPKDIGRKSTDTRLLYASMHSDVSPLTALRGKCQISHRAEIASLDEYRKTPDNFWYEKLYDRYMQKNYELIPTSLIINVPEKVKKVLNERWKYVLVEQGRGKELTSAVKLCKRCSGYCASSDSVDCAVCRNTYHMNCVRPPLLKKPSRGFAWSCAACSRAQERKLEAQHTVHAGGKHVDGEDDEMLDEDDDDFLCGEAGNIKAEDEDDSHQGTPEQIYQASLWPYRYLGVHCKPEDALDYDDRIYPRAGTRIGPRHQAVVPAWPGRPVEYEKPLETRKGGRKDAKLSKEAQAAQEAEKTRRANRPAWLQDEPAGYVARGEDMDELDPAATVSSTWNIPPPKDASTSEKPLTDKDVLDYMDQARPLWQRLGLNKHSTALQDKALELLNFDRRVSNDSTERYPALEQLRKTPRRSFREPILSSAELKKFEEGVSRYGSELGLVTRHVKSVKPGDIVRHYYYWKKTVHGKSVWSIAPGRKGKRDAKRTETVATKAADEVADNDDDSAFDSEKAVQKKCGFICFFCCTTKQRQWRRAPHNAPSMATEELLKGTVKEKGEPSPELVVALCRRCAELWRRYAVRYEELDEAAKKVLAAGGKAWKRRQDEELFKELQAAQEWGMLSPEPELTPLNGVAANGQEPPRKKLKGSLDKDPDATTSDGGNTPVPGAKKKDKIFDPASGEIPKPRTLPCAICEQLEPLGEQHVSCRECRLTVHRNCYGVVDNRIQGKWVCEMCSNDKSPQVSIHYKCVLCPVETTEHDFVEQPKLTHHKKKMSEKDRERERQEVQQARKLAEYYRKKQEELNRPLNPREPLKRTADNNWVHVTCAVWTPEVKFANAKVMEPSEGIPSIARSRYEETCAACNQQGGACIACHHCKIPLHVECARRQGHLLGFDITPVKSSRRDQFNIVTVNGESGTMTAAVWCRDHIPTKTIAHQMHEIVDDSGLSALQLYVQNYKQADLALTGTVRKANLMTIAAKMSGVSSQTAARRSSLVGAPNGTVSATQNADVIDAAFNAQQPGEKICITCGIDVSPKWWSIDKGLTNGHHGSFLSEAQKFVEQRKYQCHKCRKMKKVPKPPPPPPLQHQVAAPEPSVARPLQQEPVHVPSRIISSPSASTALPPPNSHRPEFRDSMARNPVWHHNLPHPSGPPPVQPTAHVPPPHSVLGGRPPPGPHAYQPPGPPGPARAPYDDWGRRPGSQHGSPPRHLSGGPPPLHNGAPPVTSFSGLRPPTVPGPPPPQIGGPPMVPAHQHSHASQPYVNGMPPSPRRMSGPAPPSPYLSSYPGRTTAGPPPPHASPHHGHGMPEPLPRTGDVFSHGLHPQRAPYAPHMSPPGSRSGPPPLHEPHGPPATTSRPPENRPPSGASASPSLRNLLS